MSGGYFSATAVHCNSTLLLCIPLLWLIPPSDDDCLISL